MSDIEKVIKGLLCIKGDYIPCATCKYANADGYGRGYRCKRQCASDAIALLKEQEPKAAIVTHQNEYCKDGNCPSCGHELDDNMHPKYCGYCGQAVEWNV